MTTTPTTPTTATPTVFCGNAYCPDANDALADCGACVADPHTIAHPDAPVTAYHRAAVELRRIADALDALPADLDHDPQVSVTVRPYWAFPESRRHAGTSDATACAAVDVLAAAVVGVPATVGDHSASYRYYGATALDTTAVWVNTGIYLADPDTPEAPHAEATSPVGRDQA